MNSLAIRTDGSSQIGYGHLVRTGVLARKFLEHDYQVTYLTRTPSAVSAVCPNGTDIYQLGEKEIDSILTWLHTNETNLLLTDSYDADTEYQRRLSEAVPTLVTITDDSRYTLCCDVNINGNAHAPELEYDWIGEKPKMLLGTDYLLMREVFQQLANETPPWRDPPERAIITFGGSDVNGVTPDVVRAFDGSKLEVDVIIGPGFENEDEIAAAAAATESEFRLLRNPDDLPQRMFSADIAVGATGSTVYELLVTGTPVVGIPQAKNQEIIANGIREYIKKSSMDDVREHLLKLVEQPNERRQLRRAGRQLIDAEGGNRVYEILSEIRLNA